MESSLLCVSPFTPSNKAFTPSALKAAKVPKPYLTFHGSSLSLPKGRPVPLILCPVSCAVDGISLAPTKYEAESKNTRSMAGASLALACVLGVMSCSHVMHQKAFASLETASVAMAKVANSEIEVKKITDLFIQSRGADEAEKQLRRKILSHRDDHDAAYYARMALIEVLVRREKYRDAAQHCQSLLENPKYHHILKRDGKFHLLRVFIYGMLNDNKESKKAWKTYRRAVKSGPPIVAPE